MFAKLRLKVQLYKKMLAQLKEEEAKEARYKAFITKPLNYEVIQDLVNAARYDTEVEITLQDQSKITITRKDVYDKHKTNYGDLF